MKSLLRVALILFMMLSYTNQTQASDGLETEEKQHIQNFINLIKENNPEKIKYVDYPLKRFNPAPDINSEAEFIEKYDMLFDDYLKDMIIKSNLEKDWKRVGGHGYMLYDGIIWLAPDNYKLKAINYTSNKEEAYQQRIQEESKKVLHSSIKDFAHPTLSFKTDNFIIRVDEMGQENYRYASWNKNKSTLDEPDIVIHDGIRHFYGSGGNHDYLFKFLMESWNRAILEDILELYIEGNLEDKIGCQKGTLKKYFKSGAEFLDDLERWWKQYMGMAISKRIQAPPILAVSRRSFGFGNRESQNRIYYTAKYLYLKNKNFEIN